MELKSTNGLNIFSVWSEIEKTRVLHSTRFKSREIKYNGKEKKKITRITVRIMYRRERARIDLKGCRGMNKNERKKTHLHAYLKIVGFFGQYGGTTNRNRSFIIISIV